jgi:hypothetical protein
VEFDDILEQTEKLFELITTTPAAATLTVIWFILLVVSLIISVHILKSKPDETPAWLRIGLFACLIGGVLFSSSGPAISLLSYPRFPISRVSTAKAFDNLENNERVYWLIRLIPFDPTKHPELAIGKLKQLGPPEQQFTFVAPYDELVGYNVDDAVRMTGNTYNSQQHVSAIIFPVAEHQIYPTNARGLLQVINAIETDSTNIIDKPFLRDTGLLENSEIDDLSHSNAISYWRWNKYKQYFLHYCELAEKFRCDKTYTAKKYLGGVGIDWHPLGFAQKDAEEDYCSKPTPSYCATTDWKQAEAALSSHFGARAFLIDNLKIEDIENRVLVDFANPPNQLIPDLGFRPNRR